MRIGIHAPASPIVAGSGRVGAASDHRARPDGFNPRVRYSCDRPSARNGRHPHGLRDDPCRRQERPQPVRQLRRDGGRWVTCLRVQPRLRARASILVYFPASYSFVPVWNVPRLVVTMHDTLALAHPDLVSHPQGPLAWKVKEHAARDG